MLEVGRRIEGSGSEPLTNGSGSRWLKNIPATSNVNDTKTGSTNVPISKLIIGTKPNRLYVFQKRKSNVSI